VSQIRTAPNERLQAYILANEPPEHEELRKLRDLTEAMPNARMQILPEQGHFLAFLVTLIGARRILEVGTFTGYSAMALALALPADGRVVTCDLNEEPIGVGRPCWERAGVAAKIDVVIGPAVDTLGRLERGNDETFDLAFIDADKMAYDRYYEFALRLVRPGGLIVFDNMLQRGEVADPHNIDPRTVSVRALNAKIARDDRVDRVMLPIADGMTLTRRRR
jgi:predicted O-methyltransferase YrrM